jgi:hypothetical protein
VSSQTLLQLLAHERLEMIHALKIDMGEFEDVIPRPFFHDENAQPWPRLVIFQDRGSRKTSLISTMRATGYSAIARSILNVVLRRASSAPPRARVCYSLASRRR